MFPWLWFWMPEFRFPLSGHVMQDIEPFKLLFEESDIPHKGDPVIEEKAFRISSYGQQLGWINEILIDLAEKNLPADAKSRKTLERLREVHLEIKQMKKTAYSEELVELEARLNELRTKLKEFD